MIQATALTKRYGTKLAVDRADFAVAPGKVTGFLGPNGAGKSTTMRMSPGAAAGEIAAQLGSGAARLAVRLELTEIELGLDLVAELQPGLRDDLVGPCGRHPRLGVDQQKLLFDAERQAVAPENLLHHVASVGWVIREEADTRAAD